MPKKIKKTVKVKDKVNWHSIIALASAGQYIAEQLRKELEVLKPKKK